MGGSSARVALLAGLALASFAACGEPAPATQIVVAVQAHPQVAKQLTRMVGRVFPTGARTRDQVVEQQTFPLRAEGTGAPAFPFSFGIAKGTKRDFLLVLEGYRGEELLIEHKLTAQFGNERTQLVEVVLTDACLGTASTCHDLDETCGPNGTCGPVLDVAPRDVQPGQELNDLPKVECSSALVRNQRCDHEVCDPLQDAEDCACDRKDDGRCDEPKGTGLCNEGADVLDCFCATEGDGRCDLPLANGTGMCAEGTDADDCACPYKGDGECDEGGGTGLCYRGTDGQDCLRRCQYWYDGTCDEESGACPEGTDTLDCGSDAQFVCNLPDLPIAEFPLVAEDIPCDGVDLKSACRQHCLAIVMRQYDYRGFVVPQDSCAVSEIYDLCKESSIEELNRECEVIRDRSCETTDIQGADCTPVCDDSCESAKDGVCDDGHRFTSATLKCQRGTDCTDCGVRYGATFPTVYLYDECLSHWECPGYNADPALSESQCIQLGLIESSAPYGDVARCLPDCSSAGETCPAGFTCHPVSESTKKVCKPTGGCAVGGGLK